MKHLTYSAIFLFIYSITKTASNNTNALVKALGAIKQESSRSSRNTLDQAIDNLKNKKEGDLLYTRTYTLVHSLQNTCAGSQENFLKIVQLLERLKCIEERENDLIKREAELKKQERKKQLQKLHSFGTIRDLNKKS